MISLEQTWQLARAWYHDRLEPSWRRLTDAEAVSVFERLELSGGFWRPAAAR